MALSTYLKPDVEVLQEFRNLNPIILRATLQSIIVGSSFKKIKDFDDASSTELSIGSYSGQDIELPIPVLPPSAEIREETLEVTIKNYAGSHVMPKTIIRVDGNQATLTATTKTLTDLNQDFLALGVRASTGPGNNDGDCLHIVVGPAEGYFEVQSVTQHSVVVDDPENVITNAGDLDPVGYWIGNFGWRLTEDQNFIAFTPRLDHSGIAYLAGSARRKDYTDRVVVAESIEELEAVFGAGEVTPANPLAFGMSKSLASIGANDVILGLMVEDDTVLAYQKAFEFLESEEVYCIVPLTTSPVVHQILLEHVKVMSHVEQKMERIGLFNTARQTRIIKQGYFGRFDSVTGTWGVAQGNVTATGTGLSDVVQFRQHEFAANGSVLDQTGTITPGYNRMVVYFRPNADFSFKYALNSDPLTLIDATSSFDADGILRVELTNDSINKVVFKSLAVRSSPCEVFYAKTLNKPANSEIFYPVAVPDGSMDEPNLTPTGGHRALKIRVYDSRKPNGDFLAGRLPNGMSIRVNYGLGLHTDITSAGVHAVPSDIISMVISNTDILDADKFLTEVMVLQDAGTYKVNRLSDEQATFLSANIVPGEDEIVVIDPATKDAETYSGYGETRYQVSVITSEMQIEINKVWNPDTEVFELGEFPALAHDVFYRVETPVVTNKYLLAQWYRDISKGFADKDAGRRMSHIFAPAVGISEDGITITPVQGFYFCCAYAGATQADAPQNGFTNRPFAGFARVFFTNDYFTEAQMNIIAEGGTTIVIQPRAMAPLTVRHQLTCDMTSIETREYSVTKNVDYMAKTARISFRPYIGRYLINEHTLSLLYKLGAALVERWKRDGNLIGGSVDKFVVDPLQVDKVTACFNLAVPIPLNYIRLIFVI